MHKLVVLSGLALLLSATAVLADGSAIAKRRGCPIDYEATQKAISDGDLVTVRFRVWGTKPNFLLSYLYERLSICAPAALEPKAEPSTWKNIHEKARDLKVMLAEKVDINYRPLEVAIKRLTTQFLGIGYKTRDGKWMVPGTEAKVVGSRPVRVTLGEDGRLPSKAKPIKPAVFPTDNELSNKCLRIGLPEDCLEGRKVFADHYEDAKGNRTPVSYFSFIPRDVIEVAVKLPKITARVLADDVVRFVERSRAFDAPQSVASYLLDEDLHDKATPNSMTEAEKTVRKDRAEKSWARLKKNIGRPSAIPAPEGLKFGLLVVEPHFPGNKPQALFDLKHEYSNSKIDECGGKIANDASIPVSGEDIGHAFHVAHIVGAKGHACGWTGLASDADIHIQNDKKFTRSRLSKDSISYDPIYPVHNLSYMPHKGLCAPAAHRQNMLKNFNLDYLNPLKVLTKVKASTTYVVAASKKLVKCVYDDATNPFVYTASNCVNLACQGKFDNVVTVAALDASLASELPGTRLSDTHRMLAAPGKDIVSADHLDRKNVLSFRSGSSQAAAIVSAAALRLLQAYPSLHDFGKIKKRLVATATPPSNDRLAKYLYGIVNFHRAVNSNPNEFTAWLESSDPDKPTKFKGLKIAIVAGKYSAIPPHDPTATDSGLSMQDGGPVPARIILAIVRDGVSHHAGGGPKFRNVFWRPKQGFSIGAPYDPSADDHCRLDGSPTGAATSKRLPCISLDGNGLDMTILTHLVFPVDRHNIVLELK